jgi:hypothetical protein
MWLDDRHFDLASALDAVAASCDAAADGRSGRLVATAINQMGDADCGLAEVRAAAYRADGVLPTPMVRWLLERFAALKARAALVARRNHQLVDQIERLERQLAATAQCVCRQAHQAELAGNQRRALENAAGEVC